MARLGSPIYPDIPMREDEYGKYPESWEQEVNWEKDFMDENSHRVLRFQVADGYAQYYVESERPLVLRHIATFDMYSIPDAHVRGLTLADVKNQLTAQTNLDRLFGR
jgi:hypothetical protein